MMGNRTKWIASFLLILAGLSGCGRQVPEVPDAHHIVIDGKPMTASAFLKTYCEQQVTHPTCMRVQRAMVQDATNGNAPRF